MIKIWFEMSHVMVLQGIVGDPGERGASGEKGQPVKTTEECHFIT